MKALVTMVIMLLIVAGSATAVGEIDTTRRNSAWSEMMAASRQGDDGSLIIAAEHFFSANPKADSRTEEAIQLYEGALLRWFAGLQGQPKPEDQEHLKRYKDITTSLKNGERLHQSVPLHKPSSATHAAFSSFPMDHPRPVEINWGESALRKRSERERTDQVRDWLLTAVLSDSGLTPRQIRSVLVDMPPARFGYLEPVSTFEYGETRSRSIGQGRVVALLPAQQSKEERADSLAHIADEHQKNTGHPPKELLIFEYDLAPDCESATITRRNTVAGDSLFTEASGYYTVKITDQGSLEHFLKQVDDIAQAHAADDGIWVSGRKLHTGYRSVDLEDVAALWQSEAMLQERWNRAKAFVERVEAFNKKLRSARYWTEFDKYLLEEGLKKEKAELDAEEAQLQTEFSHQGLAKGSGFSLDPAYDYAKLREDAALLFPRLKGVSEEDKSKALQALQNHNEEPFLRLLYAVRQKEKEPDVFALLDARRRRDRFQAARYDGYLVGTKVGMTLFYTDLLAKLKAIDYWNDGTINDFKPLTAVHVASIYWKEREALPGTRLWFGPQDRGYQLASQGILFGRNATRIYAASSDPLRPGKEAAPNAASQAFLGWWDCHYEEVARFEPEYQRLNEIIKWSLLLSWLSEHNSNALAYLGNIKVTHSLWFPDWAKQNRELRYRDWDRFHFYEKGHKGSATEAMPILYSKGCPDCDVYQFSGGVTLGSKEVIHERSILALHSEANELLLRPGRDFSKLSAKPNEVAMLGGLKHTFTEQSGELATLSSVNKGGVKFREPSSEMAPKPVERSYRVSDSKLDVNLRVGDVGLGRFYSEVSTDQPIRVGFQAQEIDRAQQFAEQVSSAVAKGQQAETFIATHPDVEEVVQFGPDMACDECVVVKLRGSRGYLKMQPEQTASVDVPAGWHARAASLDDGAQNYNLAWVSRNHLDAQLSRANYIKIEGRGTPGSGSVPFEFTRGPPPSGSSPENWKLGERTLRTFTDHQGNRYIPLKNAPAAMQDPLLVAAKLRNQLSASTDALQSLVSSGDSRRALLEITDNPIKAKQIIDGMKAAARSGLDRALAEGDTGQARLNLKVLSRLEQGPEIKVREALAAAESRNLEDAVRAIGDVLRGPRHDVDGALELVNRRLQSSKLGVAERVNLNQLASMLDLGSGHAFIDHDFISFEMRLTEQVANSHVVRPQEIYDGGPLYVLESPSAKGETAIFASMPEQIPRELGRIVQLPLSDLAHARPIVIETVDGARYRLAGETTTWTPATRFVKGNTPGGRIYHHYNPNAPLCYDSTQHNDVQSGDCRQSVYLFNPPPKQVAQPN
ncbi:MAG TPA: hypothetical protein VG649_06225 [Candidatus Angelobacter sp.]|nr:hypothetical protein [Candidatus Angelobacter sp.]